jgi:monovalent cation:H+ antiporter-2, CPA2 family
MAGALDLSAYRELMLVLGTAAVVVPAVVRFGINPIFGFLVAGAFLGPDGIGQLKGLVPYLDYITVADRAQINHLAEAGIVFLLFMIGLELSFERLWTMRRIVFGLGFLQVAVTGSVLMVAARLFGLSPAASIILGFAFALSSTALVVQLLSDQKRLGTSTGRTAFSILLFQDIAVVPLLVLVSVMGKGDSVSLASDLGLAALKAVIAIGAIVLLGRYVLRPLFRSVARTRSGDLFMAASLLVVIGTGLVTAASGLSMALGAFIAGLILAETEYRREIEATIEPFKGLLIGVFFFSVGMSLDFAEVLRDPIPVFGGLMLLLVIKTVLTYALARLAKINRGAAAETALLLAPGGEFAFVLLALASTQKLIPESVITLGIAITALGMALTPALGLLGRRIKLRLQPQALLPEPRTDAPVPDGVGDAPDAIVAGYGRVGELVCGMLLEHGVTFVALDNDPDLVARGRKRGHRTYFGDAANVDMLMRCGLDSARVLIITMDSRAAVENVAKVARTLKPELVIVARAKDPAHATALYAAGVTEAVPEAIEASLHISEAALIGAGVPLGLAIASIHEQRDRYRAEFQRIKRGERDPVARLRARRAAVRK